MGLIRDQPHYNDNRHLKVSGAGDGRTKPLSPTRQKGASSRGCSFNLRPEADRRVEAWVHQHRQKHHNLGRWNLKLKGGLPSR